MPLNLHVIATGPNANAEAKLSAWAATFAKDMAKFTKFWKNVKPEFGAYMSYSRFLEEGTKNMPIGHRRSATKKRSIGKPIGPHIVPAVKRNLGAITKQLGSGFVEEARKVIGGTVALTNQQVGQIWERALNDKPRRDAVANAPFEFGFHKRSIRGYATPLTPAQVAAMQPPKRRGSRG